MNCIVLSICCVYCYGIKTHSPRQTNRENMFCVQRSFIQPQRMKSCHSQAKWMGPEDTVVRKTS